MITEGILNGDLNFLAAYLTQRFGKSAADFSRIIEAGLNEAYVFLQEREIEYARKIITNMVHRVLQPFSSRYVELFKLKYFPVF